MIIVLRHKFIPGDNIVLNTIASRNSWESYETIAKALDIGVRTLKRKVALLKESKLLNSLRYPNNNFIILVGNDVGYNAYEAIEIAKYSQLLEATEDVAVDDPMLEEALKQIDPFAIYTEEDIEDNGYSNTFSATVSDFLPSKYPSPLKFSKEEAEEIDKVIETNTKEWYKPL